MYIDKSVLILLIKEESAINIGQGPCMLRIFHLILVFLLTACAWAEEGVLLSAGSNPVRLVFQGVEKAETEINKDGNLATVSNFQMEGISFDVPTHTISCTVKIEKQQ